MSHITDEQMTEAIRVRAHNGALRAMITGDATLYLTHDEADELGEEALSWCRAKGLRVTEDGDGVTIEADDVESEAQAEAKRVLADADLSMDWRDAGYDSARAAAEAIVGSGRGAVWSRTVEIVADEIE